MLSYRYWRVYCTVDNGGSLLQFQEIELFDKTDTQLFVPVPADATSSSNYGAGYEAFRAFDGDYTNTTTGTWAAAGGPMPQWIAWDMGSVTELGSVKIYPVNYSSVALPRSPKNFVIQARNSPTDVWLNITEYTDVTNWQTGTGNSFTLVAPITAYPYWRAIGFSMYNNKDLELSEFYLYASYTRVDVGSTITSNYTPVVGTITDLQDGDLNTVVNFANANSPGFHIQWQFPTDTTVEDIRLGSSTIQNKFPKSLTLQSSVDGLVWKTYKTFETIIYPGQSSLTIEPSVPITDIANYLTVEKPILNVLDYTQSVVHTSDAGPIVCKQIQSLLITRDVYFGGVGRIRGLVKLKSDIDSTEVPYFSKVRLVRLKDGLLVREQWSDKVTGAYDFKYINEKDTYVVLGYDYVSNKSAIVSNTLTPELLV